MSNTKVTANVDVNVTVDVTAKTNSFDTAQLIVPASVLIVVGALVAAFMTLGMMVFVGLGGLLVVGIVGFLLYDYAPDILSDWHYRRLERHKAKNRPIVIVVNSHEEAQKLLAAHDGTQIKVVERKLLGVNK